MAKPKSIYSLKGIFSNFLDDADKENFLIPTYQRGYKWTSFPDKGQVVILMTDLFGAFKSNSDRYYLQFITLKGIDEELEVIDGQQRLATLTIIFCVLAHLHEIRGTNFVFGKLKYQTRQNFIEKFIYNDIEQLIDAPSWVEFKNKNPEHDNQDVFFIFHAVKAIYSFINLNLLNHIPEFYEYISNNAYLIVNLLDANLNSEKIFINVNKGVKLNDEDLVKGLLITKLPLDQLNQKYRATEIEINELRTNLGRQWDDLTNWASRKDIQSFFKVDSGNSRIEWLIRLAYPEIEVDESGHPIFSYFDKLYRIEKVDAGIIFQNIRKSKMMLNDWFSEPEIANLLGYILHAEKAYKNETIWKELNGKKTKTDIILSLKLLCKKLLPLKDDTDKLRELNYEDNPKQLFNLFLMLDIGKFLPLNGRIASPYDFSKVSSEKWSIEHIFPQNAKEFKGLETLSSNDLKIIHELLPASREDLKMEQTEIGRHVLPLYDKIKAAQKECAITAEEREYLGNLLKNNAPDLHTIGNLALLVRNMNSGLSNHYFNKKREILVTKISEGKFVPYHTYDVFSKLVIASQSGLHVWSKQDILKHKEYIEKQIVSIVQYLTTQS
jgi:hypothetical protein